MVKKYLCIGVVLGTIALSACGEKVAKEQVQVEMTEVLANGQTVVVEPEMEIDDELAYWLFEKKTELKDLISKQINLESESVLVTLSPISEAEDFSCTMVLVTDSIMDDATIQQVVDNIISFISEQGGKIHKENILITNGSGEILY